MAATGEGDDGRRRRQLTVLEPEGLYPDTALEDAVLGPAVRTIRGAARHSVAEVPDDLCALADGLFMFRHWLPAEQVARFPRLRVVVRMGVGYDRLDRDALDARGITVCNVPDYGTTEVADHALALALSLRRGVVLHHDVQRTGTPEWRYLEHPVIQRPSTRTFGVLGLGRIGTAAALRAKAFGWRVLFYDPNLPNGTDLALGIGRARTIEDLFAASDTLSIHAPLNRSTRGLVTERLLRRMPPGAVVVNTARGPILDLDGLAACLRDGHLAGAGLDVLPEEPPPEPPHPLIAAYRAREPWLLGRLVVTPHSAFHTPEAWEDIRRKSAETMRDVLVEGRRTNVVPPGSE